MTRKLILLAISSAIFAFVSCGENSTGPNDSSSPTRIRESFAVAPCMATFKQPYTVKDFFDEEVFTTNTTDSFIVSEFPGDFGFDEIILYKEMEKGLYEFEVEQNSDGSLPINVTCNPDNIEQVWATFEKVTFYSDEQTTVVACTVPMGTVISENGGGYAYASSSDDHGYSIYQLLGNIYVDGCEGAEYFRAEDVEFMPNEITTYIPFGDIVLNGAE